MKKYIFKAAAACAVIMALAACQKEDSAVADASTDTTTSVTPTGSLQVTVDVQEVVSRADEVNLSTNFDTPLQSIKDNGFYLYVAQGSENVTVVKMLYRTEDGKSAQDAAAGDVLQWISYNIEDGVVTDEKKGQKTFYWVTMEGARVAAIYSPSKVLSQSDFQDGLAKSFPTEFNSFEDFKAADVLYSTNADGSASVHADDDSEDAGKITIKFNHLLSLITLEPNSRYQSSTSYVDSVVVTGLYTDYYLQLGADGNDVSDYIRPYSSNGISTVKMFRYPERESELDDYSVASELTDTIFICAIPPQNTSYVNGGLEFKFPIISSGTKTDCSFILDAAIYYPNGNLYYTIDDRDYME